MDKIIRILDNDGNFRLFVADTTELVDTSHKIHGSSPVVTAALGRLLSAASIMGTMMKGHKDVLTLSIKSDGPLSTILATSNSRGEVKGYADNYHVDIPLKSKGKLDVSGAIGRGSLYVIKDLGLKEPFSGSTELISGEIAEDLTYYFTTSEQTPSSVGLGVLVGKNLHVEHAGAFILQILPDCTDEAITKLEKNISSIPSVTSVLKEGGINLLIEKLTADFDAKIVDTTIPLYKCDCTKEKVEKALITIGKKDLETILKEDGKAELNCHFCEKKYSFSEEDLKRLLKQIE